MPERRILLGVIGRPHGVRGLVHVLSHTAEPADLTAYGPLQDGNGRKFELAWRGDGIAELAELRNGARLPVTDRNAAARLTNVRLYIDRDRLPAPEPEDFYLADLIGMEASGQGGPIGKVVAVHDYGAGASLEVERPDAPPLLVPFTRACVPEVDVEAGRLVVNPPAERDAPPPAEAAA